ncbi:MAG: tryptophan 2,3-dioxygenase [Flammeovirgaceae bacterium]|nr:tryptophan 2,3-dioxygenase [Flammeovirgaceae bacterium]
MNSKTENLIESLKKKYSNSGEDLNVHLEGLLHSKPITYWDYIQLESLLGIQNPRTKHPDEMVFIVYHQTTELIFKMILWEIDQIAVRKDLNATFFAEKLTRISRYFDLLSNSFEIMNEGMLVEQFMKFRTTLTPSSGFQSAQYRLIEFASTELINLIDIRFRKTINRNTPFEHAYEHLYWQAAGKNHNTGAKSTMLIEFQEKYMDDFITFMKYYHKTNLWTRFKSLPLEIQNELELRNAMRHYDHTVNVKWVMFHYKTAGKYLKSSTKVRATGGSNWQKYMHPKYQKRIFFPDLWSLKEQNQWGIDNLKDYNILTK